MKNVQRTLTILAGSAILLFLGNAPAPGASGRATAFAEGNASGSLGAGGTATGDISRAVGETDRVSADLVAGGTLSATFTSAFAADVVLRDPSGNVVDLPWGTGPKRTTKSVTLPATGRYEFSVRSADGSQGAYTLTVASLWSKKVVLDGTMDAAEDTISWSMPEGAVVKGKVVAVPAKSWTPNVTDATGPGGADLLTAPVTGKNGAAKVPGITGNADGAYTLGISGGAPGGRFQLQISMKVPKVAPSKIDLRNGLTPVAFEADGVKELLGDRCLACHAWVGTATQFAPFAASALQRVQSGNMPPSGPRFTASQVDLLRQWIATGKAP